MRSDARLETTVTPNFSPEGEGSCERIQFSLPSAAELGKEGSGGGRKSRSTNPWSPPQPRGTLAKQHRNQFFHTFRGRKRRYHILQISIIHPS